jgi:hypothetical protein
MKDILNLSTSTSTVGGRKVVLYFLALIAVDLTTFAGSVKVEANL